MVNPQMERTEVRLPLDVLRHNVPVDRQHVRTLAKSIEKSGQLSPILLWLHNKEIFDGFHRVEALRIVGATDALTNLVDLTPEEFRDARITSAVLHKGVTFPRVVNWARETFELTQWASRLRGSEAFHLDRATQFPGSLRQALGKGLSRDEVFEIADWVRGKSQIWGLQPEQIANMLKLADLTAPSLIPLVGVKHHPRDEVITTATLRPLVSAIPDHRAQEAIVKKALAERLNEDETRKLILSFANASTAEEQQAALTTSWLTPPKPITVTVKKTPEQQRDEDERASRDRERWRISMATEMISDVSQKLPQLAADKYPDLKPRLDSAINMLLASIAKYQGKNVNVVDRLKNEIDRLKEENDLLRRQNTALNKSLAVTKKVEEEELQLRENNP